MDLSNSDLWLGLVVVLCLANLYFQMQMDKLRGRVAEILKPAVTAADLRMSYRGLDGLRKLREAFPDVAGEVDFQALARTVQIVRILHGLIIAWAVISILLYLARNSFHV